MEKLHDGRIVAMNEFKLKTAFFCLFTALVEPAMAQTLQIECGPSEGKNFVAEGGIISPGNGGWGEDRISEGQTIFELNLDTFEASYQYKDSSGIWYDPVKEHGSVLSVVGMDLLNEGSVQFMIWHKNDDLTVSTVEVITILGLGGEQPISIMSANRHGFIYSGKVLTADCKASMKPASE